MGVFYFCSVIIDVLSFGLRVCSGGRLAGFYTIEYLRDAVYKTGGFKSLCCIFGLGQVGNRR